MSDFRFIDHSADAINEKNRRVLAALEALGQQAVTRAKQNITAAPRVDTGALRNSVGHQVDGDNELAYVGTNQEYAVYNELGTGIYLEGGGGRQTPWSYKDKKGNWHTTRGMKPIHFLKKAVQDHTNEYKRVAEQYLKG
jgi:HK97 gp10 family phage protein